MLLLSTPGASFSFEETLPPAPPPILSSLQDPELRLYFERFAYFLYQHKLNAGLGKPDALSGAIYDRCVSHLLQLLGTGPEIDSTDSYADGSGATLTGRRCKLVPSPTGSESLTALIVRKFEELRASSPAEAYDFQLFLYLAINFFFVWYCTEILCVLAPIPNTSGTHRQFPPAIRDYVKDYVKYSWTGPKPRTKDSWFSKAWFLRACAVKWSAESTLNDIRIHFADYDFASSQENLAARKLMAETLRRANIRWLESETRAIVGRLIGLPAGAGTALADAYEDFAMHGMGSGSGTIGLFGKPSYGLAFFNYNFEYSSELNATKTVKVSIGTTSTFLLCEEDNYGVSFFYFGLQDPPQGLPRIELTPFDAHGTPLRTPVKLVVNGFGDYRFKGISGPTISAASLGTPSSDFARADMRSAPERGPEEVVFIVFKHRMGARPPPPASLEAEWTFNDNRFAGADAIGGDPFSDQVLQDQLKSIISQIVNTPGVEIQTYIAGLGVGESLNHQTGDPGSDLRRSPLQVDTRQPGSTYGPLRYCYGRLLWTPSHKTLDFHALGYVSPLRCTWDAHLVETGGLSLFDTFGKYLPASADPPGQPRYNCVLSAFRAFSLCEGMMQAMMAKAAQMASAGDITTSQANALIASLTANLMQDAKAQIFTPGGGPLMRHNPEQQIVVTHSIFHSFAVQ